MRRCRMPAHVPWLPTSKSRLALGLLPSEGRDLILAGAILSITLNPLVFGSVDPVTAWLRARPRWIAWLERSGDPLATRPEKNSDEEWRDHAIIVGYGRIGELIGVGLKAQGFPFVVVDENRRRVEALRKQSLTAIYGDATAPGVLEAAGVDRAKLLILAIPQGFQKRRMIEIAGAANPHIETAVRSHRASEVAYLKDQGVGLAIMGTREVGFGLLRYALSHSGCRTRRCTPSCRRHARRAREARSSASLKPSCRKRSRSLGSIATTTRADHLNGACRSIR